MHPTQSYFAVLAELSLFITIVSRTPLPHAITNAITHAINVQPNNKFNIKIPILFVHLLFSTATIVGKKYAAKHAIIITKAMLHPFYVNKKPPNHTGGWRLETII